MKRLWIWSLLAGLFVGVALGVVLSAGVHQAPKPTGSALLRDFSLSAIGAKSGCTNWNIMEDRVYEQFPALARSKRIARRIVARAEMSENQLGSFITLFQNAIWRTFDAKAAINQGFFDLTQDGTKVVEGVNVRSRIHLPRWFYRIGDTYGVADVWYVAESGLVTLMISFIEGP